MNLNSYKNAVQEYESLFEIFQNPYAKVVNPKKAKKVMESIAKKEEKYSKNIADMNKKIGAKKKNKQFSFTERQYSDDDSEEDSN